MPKDARAIAQWLIPIGISLNTIALFLNGPGGGSPHGWTGVLKAVLQATAAACLVIAFVRLWRARKRRLRSLAEDDLSTKDPFE